MCVWLVCKLVRVVIEHYYIREKKEAKSTFVTLS